MNATWSARAKKKREEVLGLIPPKWRLPRPLPSPESQKDVTADYIRQFLSEREIDITETDAVGIVERTRTGKWTATEVVTAFCHRAALAHQLTNCLLEIFFDQAIMEAERLDANLATGKGPVGPLHGLPISFKDQFHVRGVETTMGYVGWIDTFEGVKGTRKERNVESELVREVCMLGAVPFCKSNLPHTVMSGVTWNHITGHTLNPFNRLLTCGGSSGGEAALIALRGSPLGVGTDIGGSIRYPSAFNEIYGLRPSYGRLPYLGAANSMPGQNIVPSVCGPMATSARALRLLVEATLSQEPWLHDPAVVEIPWRRELATSLPSDGTRLTFGLYKTTGEVTPLPPVQRALAFVADLIRKKGHDVIEWNPPSHLEATALALEAFKADGGVDIHYNLGLAGEPPQDRVEGNYGIRATTPKPGNEVFDLVLRHKRYQKQYMDYWNSTAKLTSSGRPVDAILSPVSPVPPHLFFATTDYGKLGYTPWVNVIDSPGVVFPVTRVDKNIDKVDETYQPLTELDGKIWEEYDPEVSHGGPVGLQLVGRRFQEEKVIALAEMFQEWLA
ncbi:hypothetical protein A1O1_04577 [Capronia coronata CBS 617.96]|uniref:amidase n=1 Tax=Capronia coronata CBS 617.96 TaxID=1182541 RepID=W9Y551_9EURO|nr:uncharacterized protein A1O1_04577 [Capronia coronata CBS 617.96]EXJ87653.1 hypothetical protein A1O1_04577 [Capronia coronata CBS 617.96]